MIHHHPVLDSKSLENQRLMRLSTYITVAGVSLIIVAKIFGWFVTESVTILASLVDSLLDICVSIMNLLAVHYALQPPDHEHRFGHGKVEDIAVFSQAVFFALSGVFVIYTATQRFFTPNEQVVSAGQFGIEILLFSIIITIIIIAFQRYVMRRAKSNVIEADSLHYFVDFLTNGCAILGIMITAYWKLPIFDNITAILISLYIVYNATKLFRKAFNNLMDHELGEDERQIIINVIRSHKNILGFHDLKTRYAGVKPFIQFHLELDENILLKQAHNISIEIEQALLARFPNAEIIIHQDPEGVVEVVTYTD